MKNELKISKVFWACGEFLNITNSERARLVASEISKTACMQDFVRKHSSWMELITESANDSSVTLEDAEEFLGFVNDYCMKKKVRMV